MQDLTIALVQFSQVWENKAQNLKRIEELILDVEADLIILPEMFNTGFSMNPGNLAEKMDGPAIQWMCEIADRRSISITGSLIVEEDGNYYNRLVWANPFGVYKYYDKGHLFGLAGEDKHYTRGTKPKLFLCKGWSICPLICYDLRFPAWSLNRFYPQNHEYDLLIYVASWPNVRSEHWNKLLVARAIENQSYVAAVNRIGTDNNGLEYSGDSAFIDFSGNVIASVHKDEKVLICTLSREQLKEYREKYPFWKDSDKVLVK